MEKDWIAALVRYGADTGLIDEGEAVYTRNLLLDAMGLDDYAPGDVPEAELCAILAALTEDAVARGLIRDTGESRDLFDTRLMNCLTPRPAQVRREFFARTAESPSAATDWFYRFCMDSNYIRRDRIRRDRKWTYDCEYGRLDVTVNLSKPEKDPRDIAAAGRAAGGGYPLCALCPENEGYAGRIGRAARSNHRLIPLELAGSRWFFQYSPYVYYNEHCIALNADHVPMHIDGETFARLFDFVRQLPHYFIGSNADLPIVGGSILSHDHFQGGRYSFAEDRAPVERSFTVPGFEDVAAGVVRWPMPVLRLRHGDPARLTALSCRVLEAWVGWTDESAGILARSGGERHNTITPIVRRRGADYEIDLVLRNNRTTPEHPLGLFHPHAERHHIKKENIGLIEVMGLAVLPGRLDGELALLEEALVSGRDPAEDPRIAHHAPWASELAERRGPLIRENVRTVLEQEVGAVFLGVLEDAGVFKRTPAGQEALGRFIRSI